MARCRKCGAYMEYRTYNGMCTSCADKYATVHVDLFAILLIPFRAWFWKYVVPIVTLGGGFGFLMIVCHLMDGDMNKYMVIGMNSVKEQSIALENEGRKEEAGRLLCGINLTGYKKWLKERREVDNKFFVTRFIPSKPEIFINGFVVSIEEKKAVIEVFDGMNKVTVTANLVTTPMVTVKAGDFVTLDGTASNIKDDSCDLNNAKIVSSGTKGYWES